MHDTGSSNYYVALHRSIANLFVCAIWVAVWFGGSVFLFFVLLGRQVICSWRAFVLHKRIRARARAMRAQICQAKSERTCQPCCQIIFDCSKLSRFYRSCNWQLLIVLLGWYKQNARGIYDDCDNVQWMLACVCACVRNRPRITTVVHCMDGRVDQEKTGCHRTCNAKQHVCEPHDIGNQIICYAVAWLNQACTHILGITLPEAWHTRTHSHAQPDTQPLTFISLHTTAYNMSDCDTLIWPRALLRYLLAVFSLANTEIAWVPSCFGQHRTYIVEAKVVPFCFCFSQCSGINRVRQHFVWMRPAECGICGQDKWPRQLHKKVSFKAEHAIARDFDRWMEGILWL